MKLTPPFPLSTIVQQFGENAVNYESVDGTIGHPGQDYAVPWGTPIPNAIEGAVVSSILSEGNPNLMAYRAVNTIYDDSGDTSYEIQYGHCSLITSAVGEILKLGDHVADVGNTGDVYVGGVEVSAAAKNAGSTAGSHLHFQVRLLRRVAANQPNVPGVHYLNDGVGQLILNGFKYEIPNFANGYNGCVNPNQFFDIIPTPSIPFKHNFQTNLSLGSTGAEVIALQTALQSLQNASGSPYMPKGVFGPYGPQTTAAVGKFQLDHGIPDSPQGVHFGPMTRAALNKLTN